jgi:enoyl-CoA hydratase
MGGGMGLSIHGRYRVVTDAVVMAMPETAIGYVPDVGASYFLNRLPGAIGTYLALTGASLNAADASYVGLATHCVTANALEALSGRLDGIGADEIEAVLAEFRHEPGGASDLREHRGAIDRCFAAGSVDEILRRLDGEGTPWAGDTHRMLEGRSPNSLRLALKLLHRNRTLSLAECLEIELRLARAITRTPDFIEGVRAVLVDKDRRPRWSDVDMALDGLLAA